MSGPPTFRLDQCTSDEVSRLLGNDRNLAGLILPIGCTEQHGPGIPLGCDTAIARGAAEGLAKALGAHPRYRALVMPDLAYTPSPGAESVPGTVSVGFGVIGALLEDVLRAAMRTPWRFLCIVNGHAHNHGRVIEASMAGASGALGTKIPVPVIHVYDFSLAASEAGLSQGSHAGEFECALYAHYTGWHPAEALPMRDPWRPRRRRPQRIFGLDIMERSIDGIISDCRPDYAKALASAGEVGRRVDGLMLEALVESLDTYFEDWAA